MSDIAIRVEGLSKQYRIGRRQERYKTLRDSLAGATRTLFHRNGNGASGEEVIWALQDVSFEVKHGEVVGVIGRNGAGKSTLLKILSRITEPTEGYADVYGRVGSLLEVGTGFHPELTGRENIYLNGAILGMKRIEIDRRFDEIVSFAEVERFIDTPVKHYSSGMYLRLAFAVAAHLEPEILLVDEVLAVGDAAFQKKCLGKMGEVASEGRTVVFVSHNMQAIQALCMRALRIHLGRVSDNGKADRVVAAYFTAGAQTDNKVCWSGEAAPGNNELKLMGLRIYSPTVDTGNSFSTKDELVVEVDFTLQIKHPALCVGFDMVTVSGEAVLRSYQTDQAPEAWPEPQLGRNLWQCTIPAGLLNAGVYCLCPRIGLHNMYWIVHEDPVVRFELTLDHGVSPFWNSLDSRRRPGVVAPIFSWQALSASS